MNMYTRESPFTPIFERLVNGYLADYPDVEFEYESMSGTEEYSTKFNVYIAARTLPDIFLTRDDLTPDLVRQNILRPLDDILDREWKDNFIPMWSEETVDGKIYGIPFQFITNQAVYYNKNILAEAGYTGFPKTWEDWMSLCEKLKRAGYIPIALGDVEGWPLWSFIGEPLTQFMCGNEWVVNCGLFNGKTSYNDPDFVKTMNMINDIMKNGYFNSDVVAANGTDVSAYYFTGKAAMLMSGSWTAGGMLIDAPEEIYRVTGVAPLPRPAAAKPEVEYGMYTGGSGWAYALNPGVDGEGKLDLCTGILRALLGNESALGSLEVGNMPAWTIDTITGIERVNISPLLRAFLDSVAEAPAVYPLNRQQNGPAMTQIIYAKTQEMLSGTVTPADACRAIQAVFEEYSKIR